MEDKKPTYADLLRAKEELKALEDRKAMLLANGLLGYEPHHKQDLFHRAGKYRLRYVRTGNRFGKSTMGAAEDVAWALGYRPWYPEGDEARYAGIPQRAIKLLILCADWDKCEEIFTNQVEGAGKGKLFKFIPKDSFVNAIKNQSGKVCEIQIKSIHGGISSICLDTVKSFKSNSMGQESSNWDAIHVDEPICEEMWVANSRGLMDTEGSAWFTCTPISEMWINDLFIPDGNYRDKMSDGFVANRTISVGEVKIDIESWMITGSTHDNERISDKAKALFIASLTEEQRETRIDGRPAQLTGCIYKEFRPEIHVPLNLMKHWKDWDCPPADYTIRVAVDTHPSTPHAVLFVATAPTGHNFFFSEIFEKVFVKDLCERIKERLAGRDPLRVLLEQAAYNDDPFDGVTIADEFYAAGLPVEKATKDLSYGILKVQQELGKRDEKGRPWLNFSPYLTRTFFEFDRYVWNPKTGKPVDKNDHMMECLYRLILTGLEYVAPEPTTVRQVQKVNAVNFDFSLPDYPSYSKPFGSQKAKPRYRSGDSAMVYSQRH